MAEEAQTPTPKGKDTNEDEAGNREFNQFRFTPYTTDIAFFSDPVIYEAGEMSRAAPESRQPAPNHRPDEDVKDEIDRLLSLHDQVDAAGVQVEVKDGVVTLSGNVRSQQELQTVENMTVNVLGVSEVHNHLKAKNLEQ